MKPKKNNLKTLDLHGRTQDEVYDAVDQFIHQNQNQKRLRIMSGKGKGIVQKAVVQYLKQAGYPWEYEKLPNGTSNEGCIVVFVD